MKRFVLWILFETRLGDRVVYAMERWFGLAITTVETMDEATEALLQAMVA